MARARYQLSRTLKLQAAVEADERRIKLYIRYAKKRVQVLGILAAHSRRVAEEDGGRRTFGADKTTAAIK